MNLSVDELREEMYKAINEHGRESIEAVKASQKLDDAIVEEQLKMMSKKE